MPAPRRFQRIEETVAVQYVKGDKEAESAIRGWLKLGVLSTIPLIEGSWVVKRRGDEQVYIVRPEDFVEEFVEVINA